MLDVLTSLNWIGSFRCGRTAGRVSVRELERTEQDPLEICPDQTSKNATRYHNGDKRKHAAAATNVLTP